MPGVEDVELWNRGGQRANELIDGKEPLLPTGFCLCVARRENLHLKCHIALAPPRHQTGKQQRCRTKIGRMVVPT